MARPVGSGNLGCLLDMGVVIYTSGHPSQGVVILQAVFPNFGVTKIQASGFPFKDKEPQHKGYTMAHGLHACALSLEIYFRTNSMAAFLIQTKLPKMPVHLCSGTFVQLWASKR